MKIAVSAEGPDKDSSCCPRFGRAPYFVIYDDETKEYSPIDNVQNLNAASGAGVQSALTVSQAGGERVISGHIGPKALSVLQAAGIKVTIGASGTVAETLAAFKEGRLEDVQAADVPPHW